MQMYKKVAYKCMTSHLRCTRNAAPFCSLYSFNVNCLHSALFICTTLIFKRFRRVDNSKIYLHAVCTQLHSCLHHLHLFALVCTIYTYLHLSALSTLLALISISTSVHVLCRLHIAA